MAMSGATMAEKIVVQLELTRTFTAPERVLLVTEWTAICTGMLNEFAALSVVAAGSFTNGGGAVTGTGGPIT